MITAFFITIKYIGALLPLRIKFSTGRTSGFFPVPYSLFPIPCSLFPTPCSLFPTPYSLLPTPYSLNL
ncbi:MAG: hypothetical protein F6J90_34955 [Moorea sp. SIOASIH]|uniref:hypothetical protein n=1 Tax=Moorena sp. SIOASIH TaxID=2607817 RepID=UPI0013B75A6B|nr:hypothetical protein [Moorena sp. SIOASIH]NEO41250.1 hypothetical protein [Moorena sp. SIOASIH]